MVQPGACEPRGSGTVRHKCPGATGVTYYTHYTLYQMQGADACPPPGQLSTPPDNREKCVCVAEYSVSACLYVCAVCELERQGDEQTDGRTDNRGSHTAHSLTLFLSPSPRSGSWLVLAGYRGARVCVRPQGVFFSLPPFTLGPVWPSLFSEPSRERQNRASAQTATPHHTAQSSQQPSRRVLALPPPFLVAPDPGLGDSSPVVAQPWRPEEPASPGPARIQVSGFWGSGKEPTDRPD